MGCGGCAQVAQGIAQGAATLARAVSTDDWADEGLRTHRARVCKSCPSARRDVDAEGPGLFCGRPLMPTDTTCGCLIALKVRVRSERCPQGKW